MLSLTVAGAHCIYLSLVLPGSLAPCRSLARSLSSSLWCSLALSIPVALSLSRSLALVRSRSSSVALSLSLLNLFPPLSLYLSSSLSLSLSLYPFLSLPPSLPSSLFPSLPPLSIYQSLSVYLSLLPVCASLPVSVVPSGSSRIEGWSGSGYWRHTPNQRPYGRNAQQRVVGAFWGHRAHDRRCDRTWR